jgi:hypothetical protein
VPTTCQICDIRRPRRFCPGVDGEICALCCGREREETINCPLDCRYLQEARFHEKPRNVAEAEMPNKEISVTDKFLNENVVLLQVVATLLVNEALEASLVDYDLRDALDALTRTYRTLQSGLYYDSRPSNPLAARLTEIFCERIGDIQKRAAESSGAPRIRDADILGVLVFLQRVEFTANNGRKKGRAFIDLMLKQFGSAAKRPHEEPVILL